MKLTMPAEWELHARTWMSWPPKNYLLGESDEEAELTRTAWANVANAIAKFEPVTVLATSDQIELARNYLHQSIEIVEAELNDACPAAAAVPLLNNAESPTATKFPRIVLL